MQVMKDRVVQFNYQLHGSDGTLIESSDGGDPVAYLHGHQNIIQGLENGLEGAKSGDKLSLTLPPEEAYGQRKEGSIQRIPIKHLHTRKNLKPGMVVHVQTDEGTREVVILKVGRFNIDADLNHPLAGRTLTFEIEIVGVREATAEELEHKHAHGKGGHSH